MKKSIILILLIIISSCSSDSENNAVNSTPTLTNNGNAQFTPRYDFGICSFNNNLYVIGGYKTPTFNNEIWKSSDGINWIQVTNNAPFSKRSGHKIFEFNSKLWLIGGYDTNGSPMFKNDIWNSSDGINWTQVSNNAPFSQRTNFGLVIFNSKIYLIGGYNTYGTPLFKNDIWSSVDGINWTLVTNNAPFSQRSNFGLTVFNSKIYLIGGYNTYGTPMFKKDVWSSNDGTNWTLETNNTPFSERSDFGLVNYNSKLWLIGGYKTPTFNNEIWNSNDGVNWTRETSLSNFSERAYSGVCTFQNKIFIIGGYKTPTFFNDIITIQ
jgi:N-acetylneuraminic acid mutarotase